MPGAPFASHVLAIMQDVEGRPISYRCASQLEVVRNVGCVCLVLLLQAMSCSFSILCLHFLAVNLMTGVCMVDVMQFCSRSPSFAPAGGKEVILISKSRISLSSLSFHPVCSRWQKHTLPFPFFSTLILVGGKDALLGHPTTLAIAGLVSGAVSFRKNWRSCK